MTLGLEALRRDFIAGLSRRMAALGRTLGELAAAPEAPAAREELATKLTASATACRALGLVLTARVLEEQRSRLAAAALGGTVPAELIAELRRVVAALPELVADERGGAASGPALPPPTGTPRCLLAVGTASLEASLRALGDEVEVELLETPDSLVERALALAPDAIVVDGTLPRSTEAVEAILRAVDLDPPAVLVVGQLEGSDTAARLASLGVSRVLPHPTSPEALGRALDAVVEERGVPRASADPVGDVTVASLAERVAAEIRRGLIGSAEIGTETLTVPLGEGVDVLAAVWGSVARIRELVTMRSGGAVRFRAMGPEGAIPLAPWAGGDRRQGGGGRGLASPVEVPLARRCAVVADDDPAVVWFLSGLLQQAGLRVLEAHDGERALALTLEHHPDVVISDLLMPRRDGFSLARELRRDVAVRDVPVLLLSWKEDLLERARELGAEAAGYLRKEAAASVVLERVREALRPRARVERRLRQGGEVRGRLDGLTPRLVLELVCAQGSSARVAFRDAVHLHEVEVREGRLRSVTRTAPDGSFERGEGALASLVAVAAGRFVVSPTATPCRVDFDAPLAEILRPILARIRAVLRALAPERIERIASLSLELGAMQGLLAVSPPEAVRIVERLAAGEAPRHLVGEGRLPLRLVEELLADLARHGAVRAVLGYEGEDLVALADAPPTPRPAASAVELPTPAPMFTFALSPAPAPLCQGTPSMAVGVTRASAPPPEARVEPVTVAESLRDELPRVQSAIAAVEPAVPGQVDDDAGLAPGLAAGAPAVKARITFPRRPAASLSEASVAARGDAEPPAAEPSVAEPPAAEPSVAEPPAAEPSVAEPPAAEPPAAEPPAAEPPAAEPPAAEPPVAAAAAIAEPEVRPLAFPPVAGAGGRGAGSATVAAAAPEPTAQDEELADVATSVTPPHVGHRLSEMGGLEELTPPPGVGWERQRLLQVSGNVLRVGGITALTALLSFGVVRIAFAPGASPAAAPAAAASVATVGDAVSGAPPAPAIAAPSAGVLAAAAAPRSVQVEQLDLPPGFVVGDGKGMLEVVTQGRESIYVGGTFVGRGPTRRVPLNPGRHEVEIRSDGESRRQQLEVSAGRRQRVTFGG